MRRRRRFVTVIVQPDAKLASRTYRLPVWLLRLGAAAVATLLAALALGLVLYGPIVRTAARVPGLERDLAGLRADNAKVQKLAAAVDSVESRYTQLRQMIGADIVRSPVAVSSALPVAPPLRSRGAAAGSRYETGPTEPHHWPLDEAGYLTRGRIGDDSNTEAHPGIDIAVSAGSVVRAAGGGTVVKAGEDPEYGLFVLLEHPSAYQTMYGHLSRLVVASGDQVEPGAVLGLSGNSGRSTAPHLHFEIRHEGRTIDPLAMVKEES